MKTHAVILSPPAAEVEGSSDVPRGNVSYMNNQVCTRARAHTHTHTLHVWECILHTLPHVAEVTPRSLTEHLLCG
jgi:hypothetical protein